MKTLSPSTVCRKCPHKQATGRNVCPFARKDMCPEYQAAIATVALKWKDSALYVPIESLVAAIRYHGYTGELRKSSTVII